MPKKTVKGTGITARPMLTYESHEITDAFEAIIEEQNKLKVDSLIDRELMRHEELARRTLLSAGLNPEEPFRRPRVEPDSPVDYAFRMLVQITMIRNARRNGEVDFALMEAARFGELVTEMRIKFRWERFALRAAKSEKELLGAATELNRRRKNQAKAHYARWQTLAEAVWSKHPAWSARQVAVTIRRQHGLAAAADWIRQKIKKPPTR